MSTKVRNKTSDKQKTRFKHKKKINDKLSGTSERPRLCVFRSNQHMYAQIIDDVKGHTLASASTGDAELKKSGSNIGAAKTIGNLLAKKALALKIEAVVFDRGGYLYHGRVQALADGAREGGLKF